GGDLEVERADALEDERSRPDRAGGQRAGGHELAPRLELEARRVDSRSDDPRPRGEPLEAFPPDLAHVGLAQTRDAGAPGERLLGAARAATATLVPAPF